MLKLNPTLKGQDYLKNNYPRCFEPICEFEDYTTRREDDLEIDRLFRKQMLNNLIKLHK